MVFELIVSQLLAPGATCTPHGVEGVGPFPPLDRHVDIQCWTTGVQLLDHLKTQNIRQIRNLNGHRSWGETNQSAALSALLWNLWNLCILRHISEYSGPDGA